jgi:hypothetical protein
MHFRIQLFFLLVSLFFSVPGNAGECADGDLTHFESQRLNWPTVIRHDQSIGQTTVGLRSKSDGTSIFSEAIEGHWFCIGYNSDTKTYILGGISERGAWLTLNSIRYLREDGQFKPSEFDRSDYLAMTATVSPKGRYVVFIGNKSPTTGNLFVLDSVRNTIRKLGVAPGPPPQRNANAISICRGEPFIWGSCWADGFVKMDAGIIAFRSDNILIVSYGRDRPSGRAKKRQNREFRLG